jgi:Ca-activated chloride channel family protein
VKTAVVLFAGVLALQLPGFRSRTDTVAVYPSVRDASNRLVSGLTKEDFVVEVDGKPVEVTSFGVQALPISAVLLLDMSTSVTSSFLVIRQSARHFVTALGPNDRVRIGTFGMGEVALSPHLTNDRALLNRVIDEELWPGGSTPLWRAVHAAIESIVTEPDRRVVVTLSDGLDNSPGRGPAEDAAERTRTMLEDLAIASGGGRIRLAEGEDPQKAFDTLLVELRSQYVVGFTPPVLDGRTHRLRVQARHRDWRVQAPTRIFLGERK